MLRSEGAVSESQQRAPHRKVWGLHGTLNDPAYRGFGVGYRLQQARMAEKRDLGIRRIRTETDRAETISWYIRKFGYRKIGSNPKKHAFSLPDVDHWTVLELKLGDGPQEKAGKGTTNDSDI